jgi:hypothetical protein
MPNLASLDVRRNHVADISAFAGTPNLTNLSVTGQQLSLPPAQARTWLANPVTFIDGSHLDLEAAAADRVMGSNNATYCLVTAGNHSGGFSRELRTATAIYSLGGYWEQTATTAAADSAPCDPPKVLTPPPSCGLKQVVVTPRLVSVGGRETTLDPERGQVVRVCQNGDLWVNDLNSAKRLNGGGKIASGLTGLKFYAPGDWNKDGWNDLIGIDQAGDMWLFPRTAADTFGAKKKIGRGWGGFKAVVPVGDVTSDGNPDLLVIDKKGDLLYYAGNGTGGWKSPHGTKCGWGWSNVDLLPAGDVTGDGKGDIVGILANGDLYSYRGLGTGQFTGKTKAGVGWRGVSATGGASLDGDLTADLIGVDRAGQVSFYRGTGRAGFATYRGAATGWR